jgi:hypothetical protein
MMELYISGDRINEFSLSGFNLSISREDDSPRVRVLASGDITFWASSYTKLFGLRSQGKTHATTEIKYNGTSLVTFQLELMGEWDEVANLCKLGCIAQDRYTEVINNIEESKTFNHKRDSTGDYVSYNVKSYIRQMVARVTDTNHDWPNKEWVKGTEKTALAKEWTANKCYKKSKVYDSAKIYIGDEDNSFVTRGGNVYAAIKTSRGADPSQNDKAWRQVSAQLWQATQLTADLPIISRYGFVQDTDDKYFVKSSDSTQADYRLIMPAFNLYDVLRDLLQIADSTITINKASYFPSLKLSIRLSRKYLFTSGSTHTIPTR